MEDKYWLWLMNLDISLRRKLEILKEYGDPKQLYYKFAFDERLPLKVNTELLNEDKKEIAEIMFKYIKKHKIRILKYTDELYPKSLKEIYDPPVALLAIGNLELIKRKKIAIVGARDCSSYGIEMTKEISNYLSKKEYTIVSGLAKGIDAVAHKSTVKNNTIAVIGSGITKNTFYPKENYNLFLQIIKEGGLVLSELMPNSLVKKWNFPMRNRIISGISDAVIITEAKKASGSLITARFALEGGKEIYTIPGNIDKQKYDGNNLLIRDGAIPITELSDLDLYF